MVASVHCSPWLHSWLEAVTRCCFFLSPPLGEDIVRGYWHILPWPPQWSKKEKENVNRRLLVFPSVKRNRHNYELKRKCHPSPQGYNVNNPDRGEQTNCRSGVERQKRKWNPCATRHKGLELISPSSSWADAGRRWFLGAKWQAGVTKGILRNWGH